MKIYYFLFAIVFSIAFGCTTKTKKVSIPERPNLPNLYYAGSDTTVVDSCQAFVLKKWKGKRCDGKTIIGTTWKPAGFDVNQHRLIQQGHPVPADSIAKWFGIKPSPTIEEGRTNVPDQSSSRDNVSNHNGKSSSFWSFGWLWDFLKLLLAIALILFLLWLLWELFLLFRGKILTTGKSSTGSVKSSSGKENKIGPKAPIFTEPSTVSDKTESKHGYEGATAFLAQLQKTGGKASFGDLILDIPMKGPNIHLTNSGIMGDVMVEASSYEETSLNDIDARQFSRTSAGKQENEKKKETDN